MLDLAVYIVGAVSLATVLLIWISLYSSTNVSGLPFPPGPPQLPLLGNLLDINTAEPWTTYTAWREKYGEIVYSRLLGQDYIIINSARVAKALLDQRSSKYSGRPVFSIKKNFSVDWMTGFLDYTDELKLHRKLFHQTLRSEAAAKYQDLYLRKARELVSNILVNSDDTKLRDHLKTFAGSLVMAVTYGYEAALENDPFVTRVSELTDIINVLARPERAALVDAFPILHYLPAWFPGFGFKRLIPRCHRLVQEVRNAPFEYTREEVANGTASHSMVSDFLQNQMDNGENSSEKKADLERAMKATAASVFVGVFSICTSSTLLTFMLAMVLYPRVQERACAEIDAVVGSSRLPNFDDRPSLPYVEAVLREVIRWHSISPLGLPHATTTSDTFEGYYIPKGAIIIGNAWALSHTSSDPNDDAQFNPDRYLSTDGKYSPATAFTADPAFGFGRRICPGRFFAEGSAWAAIVTVLSVLRIGKARDAQGKEIEVKGDFTTGASAIHPVHFRCSITSGSPEKESSLRMGL
ncbi:cytochrome P450 [Hygrophoropsis aurantiaca]|uniref:Cytochrome P450 n=1 Tax=Hygrophoropsis aurantiaca TaxID=72124 RepID=A0ACB8A6U8_9AGAM|nr:cytochrome P450 [Hygrophoropsis aurantiaca]